MVVCLAPKSRHTVWPTKERRCPMSHSTRRIRPKCTATQASTVASVGTPRWHKKFVGQSLIRSMSPLMEKPSWGWEEARSMDGTGLATAKSTRRLFLLSRRFELGVPAQVLPYVHGQTLHRLRLRLSRLFLFHPSFLHFYIRLLWILTLGSNHLGLDGSSLTSTAKGGRGEVAGRAGRDAAKIGSSSNIYAKPGLGDGCFASTIPSGPTCSSCRYSSYRKWLWLLSSFIHLSDSALI